MKPTTTEKLDLSLRSAVGFSLVELMVVVTVIGALAVIGVPRFRTMMARARQAEAKTNLEQLHKLNTLHQTAKDRYAAWAKTDSVGYRGAGMRKCKIEGTGAVAKSSTNGNCYSCADSNHNNANMTKAACTASGRTGCKWRATRPGAKDLGFILASCSSSRYQYWIQHKEIGGREYYHAAAYSPSDPDGRIYPTCTGATGGSRNTELVHPSQSDNALKIPTTGQGDQQSISEDKVFGHSDIVTACE